MTPLHRLADTLIEHARAHPSFANALRSAASFVLAKLDSLDRAAQSEVAHSPGEAGHPEAARTPIALLKAAYAPEAPGREPGGESGGEPGASAGAAQTEVTDIALAHLIKHFQDGGAYGDTQSTQPQRPPQIGSAAHVDDAVLFSLAERFRGKAMTARWHANGAQNGALPALRSRLGEIDDLDADALKRPVAGATAEGWDALARTYAAAATAAAVLAAFCDAGLVLQRGTPFAQAVVASAKAQSALRAAYWALRGKDAAKNSPSTVHDDSDQVALFRWLREATEVDEVYVERHMKWEDPADPAEAEAVVRHLRGIASGAGISLEEPNPTAAARHFKALAYHAGRLRKHPDDFDADHQKKRIYHFIQAALESGVPPTDVRFREHLRPVSEALPDADAPELSPRVRRTLAALYDFLAEEIAAEETAEEAEASEAKAPAHVARAAKLLAGKRLAMFGGTPRPEAADALKSALGLADIDWVETRVHQSPAPFESAVAKADVAVVLIRWSSHSFGAVRDQCAAHGTHFVRGVGGYNPSRIARDILDQVSDELRATQT